MMNLEWGHQDHLAQPSIDTSDFPQRAGIFDPEVVSGHARAGGLGDVTGCTVLNVWYIAGRKLSVVYRLTLSGRPPATYAFHFFRDSTSAQAYASSPSGRGLHLLASWNALAAEFPCDPGLPALATLTDADAVAAHLPEPLRRAVGGCAMQWTLLSYLPGERAAVRQAWPAAGLTVVGKLQPDAAASHRAMWDLWNAPGRRFGMPEPLAAASALPLRWERYVEGQRIEALLPGASAETLLAQVARGLVGLHASELPELPVRGHRDVLARLQHKVLRRIGVALPSLSERSARFADELARHAAALPNRTPHVVHGDLHTANLLLAGDQAVFIDLDSLALGDPAFDLALLGTRLILWDLNAGTAGAVIDSGGRGIPAAVAALPALYAAAGGDPIPERLYAWYVAALLVGRQLKTCIRHLAPGLPRLAPVLLAMAEGILADGVVSVERLGRPRADVIPA